MAGTLLRHGVAAWRELRLGARARRRSLGAPLVRRLIVMLQSGCALRCRMCDLWLEPPSALTPEAVLELLRSPALAPDAGVHWTGGEPFLYPDFAGLFLRARALRPRAAMSVSSSGSPADAALGFLERVRDLSGTTLVFSYDGPGAHDEQRGRPGAEAELLGLLRRVRLERPELRVSARMTITRWNAGAVLPAYLAMRALGVPLQLAAAGAVEEYTNGVRAGGPERLAPSPEQLPALERDLRELFSRLSLRSEREEMGHLAGLLRRIRSGRPWEAEPRRWSSCPVPCQSAQVRSDGAVLTCRGARPVGSALEGGLEAAWRSPAAEALRREGCGRCEPRFDEF